MTRVSAQGAFVYLGVKPGGGRTWGLRPVATRAALAESLRRERVLLLQAYPVPGWLVPARAPGSGALTLADQAVMNDQLAALLSRGVPLVEALDVAAQTVTTRARPRVARIKDQVASGMAYSEACRVSKAFDDVTVSVYRAAERTGDLAGAAKQLAATARRTLQVVGKATTLMIYPAIVITISLLIALLMVVGIVPQMGQTLAEAGVELPWVTRAMMNIGLGVRAYWLLAVLATLALAGGLWFARGMLAAVLARATRSLPLVREVVLAQESARFFSVLAAMSRSGVPLADALQTANQAITHPLLRTQMDRLRQRLVDGGVLRQLIDEVSTLPLATRRLLIAAERAGDMESAFVTLASDMTDEVDRRSSRLLAVLQPMVIVFMFLIIGSLLMTIMVPMLRVAGSVGG